MITSTTNLNQFKALSNDLINWKQFGKSRAILDVTNNSNVGKTQGNITFKVTTPQKCTLRTQGSQSSWPGNFKPNGKGMRLLLTFDALHRGGPITIVFPNSPVKGVGVQFQQLFGVSTSDWPPGSQGVLFRASLKAFKNGQSTPIAEPPPINGQSDTGATQAVFLGVFDNVAAIDSVQLNTQGTHTNDSGDFAIGSQALN
jgi:hypothetical protein